MASHESSLAAAARKLRGCHTGILLCDGTPEPVRLVLEPQTGRPVMPVPPRSLDADEHVLYLPDEGEGSLQLLVIPEEIDSATSPGADRWLAYHGDARAARWARFAIDCARLGRAVLDGDELSVPNALAIHEPALLRRAAARPSGLAAAAAIGAGRPIDSPTAVGVDAFGLDLRARFGIVRLEFAEPVLPGPGAAERAAVQIDLLLAPANGEKS